MRDMIKANRAVIAGLQPRKHRRSKWRKEGGEWKGMPCISQRIGHNRHSARAAFKLMKLEFNKGEWVVEFGISIRRLIRNSQTRK